MDKTFFFYDLETTGYNPRDGRIMQFAGQRTDMNLKDQGQPVNYLIRLTPDILPDPEAILITGITPQQTQGSGLGEAEFLKLFDKQVNTPGTTFVGYNNIRFDDEFMRFLFYRNLYDPYTWQWQDGRSRWDLLDLVRMTRALRPKGIQWPLDENGKPSNRLGLLTSANKLPHQNAHDALSDARATLDLARLLLAKQPKLFHFLYEHRDKKQVADLIQKNKSFVYTNGKFPSEFEKTTLVQVVSEHPSRAGVLVYDLRYSPEPFAKMDAEQLASAWRLSRNEEGLKLPVKSLLFNRCPAIAPLSVLDDSSIKRLKLDLKQINSHKAALNLITDFPAKLVAAQKILDKNQEYRMNTTPLTTVDSQLYDGFFSDQDRRLMQTVHQAEPLELPKLEVKFGDKRLLQLFPLFVARNYPDILTAPQLEEWENYRQTVLLGGGKNSRLAWYLNQLEELKKSKLSSTQKKIVKALEDWAETVKPTPDDRAAYSQNS